MLFVPATARNFVAKAHLRGADVIILDLEDSVPPGGKDAARQALADAARQVGQSGAEVCVRINRALDLAVADIRAAVAAGATALMLPKLLGPDHVRLLAEVAAAEEARCMVPAGRTRFIGIVETAAALPRLDEIAGADARMAALGIGGEDLAMDMEAEPSADCLYLPAMQGLLAARGAGLLPLGVIGAFAGFDDLDGYRAALRRSRALGFACAACIHPSQVPIINEEYGVTREAADRARRLIAAFESALQQGRGAVAFEGAMVDLPVAQRARRLLARAREPSMTEQRT
jgi:citrate lyase subunit beta/citryl-CoA lyase